MSLRDELTPFERIVIGEAVIINSGTPPPPPPPPPSSPLPFPGSREQIDVANAHIASGALYKALKEIWKLMKREEEQVAA